MVLKRVRAQFGYCFESCFEAGKAEAKKAAKERKMAKTMKSRMDDGPHLTGGCSELESSQSFDIESAEIYSLTP